METAALFKYLVRVLKKGCDDCLAVVGNLSESRKSWIRMTRIPSQEGEDPKFSGLFFKAVVQLVLLFRAEMWVLTPRMERYLSRFQHKVAWQLTWIQPRWR